MASRRGRLGRVAVALAALLVVVAGQSAPVASQTGAAPTLDLAGANALLDERERALATGDRDAWMATVDPASPRGFRDAQGRQFDGLRAVGLSSFTLTARLADSGDLNPDPDRFLPETRMVHRLAGYDERDAVDHLWLTFVVRDGTLVITSDSDVEDVGLDSARGIWDTGEVRTTRSEHFLVLHHPAESERAGEIARIAEEALATLRPRWDRPWSEKLPIVLPSSTDELEILLQSTIDLDKFVAFVSYGVLRDGGYATTAPRMYIQDGNLGGYSRSFQIETLVHELVHAAAAPFAGPAVPVWVHEGVADWIATGRSTVERKPAGGDETLPRDFEFSTGSQASIIRAYRESRSAIGVLAKTVGLGAPTAFFVALGSDITGAGSIDHRVDLALRQSSPLGLDGLQQAWAGR